MPKAGRDVDAVDVDGAGGGAGSSAGGVDGGQWMIRPMDDKGESVGKWKGPLIGVMWAEDGARGTWPRGVGKDEGGE